MEPKLTSSSIAASAVYPRRSGVNANGHLEIGGCDVVELAAEFGTPAYIYDPTDISSRAAEYTDGLAALGVEAEVLFASKAAPVSAIYSLCREQGLAVDVASGGELHMALRAGYEPERIFMHGNNKTEAELAYAIESGVGHIIVDSFDEIERLDRILDRSQRVLIRLTPGIKPSTHTYIQTGQLDSKFGFALADEMARRAVEAVRASRHLELVGLHAHIGSQIFELEPYTRAAEVIARFASEVEVEVELLNLGGGLGVAYSDDDDPPSIADYLAVKVEAMRRLFDPLPKLLVEPGRSLVANAGVTIYRVGTVKRIEGLRTYVAVDGGMSDNLRPMLYGSRYLAAIAERITAVADSTVTICGMHCESGDVLIHDAEIPAPAVGETLVTPATGAYGHAMANNYNGVARPPVIFCSGGRAEVVVRRESWDDLLARDVER